MPLRHIPPPANVGQTMKQQVDRALSSAAVREEMLGGQPNTDVRRLVISQPHAVYAIPDAKEYSPEWLGTVQQIGWRYLFLNPDGTPLFAFDLRTGSAHGMLTRSLAVDGFVSVLADRAAQDDFAKIQYESRSLIGPHVQADFLWLAADDHDWLAPLRDGIGDLKRNVFYRPRDIAAELTQARQSIPPIRYTDQGEPY